VGRSLAGMELDTYPRVLFSIRQANLTAPSIGSAIGRRRPPRFGGSLGAKRGRLLFERPL